VLADQATDHPFERPMDHLDHRALANQRTRVVGEIAVDQQADTFDLVLGNRRRLTFEGNDVHDTSALENRQPLTRVEAGEAIAWKQRPVDLLLAVLPAA